jgi:hypothetical protein
MPTVIPWAVLPATCPALLVDGDGLRPCVLPADAACDVPAELHAHNGTASIAETAAAAASPRTRAAGFFMTALPGLIGRPVWHDGFRADVT